MKLRLLLAFFVFPAILLNAQEININTGKVSARIYSNFNYGFTEETHTTAFEITRAYFGYENNISEHFFANVKLDIGSPDDLSEYSKLRRYAYFKNAAVSYRKGKILAVAGLFDMYQFKLQEEFWGYRYLYKSYMDAYRFGPSADLGMAVQYVINDLMTSDLCISNGEGYTSPQRDNTYKLSGGITLYPVEKIVLRAHYSIFMHEEPEMTFSGFAGYRANQFRLGGEFNYQKNYNSYTGHHRYGYSVYSTYVINNMWEIFGRYDQLYSNIVGDDLIPWNLPEDGSAVIAGIQYTPVNNLHICLDYQDWVQYAGNGDSEPFIYVHFEVKF